MINFMENNDFSLSLNSADVVKEPIYDVMYAIFPALIDS